MKTIIQVLIVLLCAFRVQAGVAPPQVDTMVVTSDDDTVRFVFRIPLDYSSDYPPPILVAWHQLGGSRFEIFNTGFNQAAMSRGWILVSHDGPNDRHWNTERPQKHCKAMLDWIYDHYPFCFDSIYMVGGSMGGAAGQIWHNNNCGIHDYLIAAAAGGSPILDTQLRQEQYLASGDTNRSMREAFGGFPFDSPEVAFEYHRYSATVFSDSTQAMHYNAKHLPKWITWGNTEPERVAYGYPTQDFMAQWGDFFDTTMYFQATAAGHGLYIMNAESVCNWLHGFGVNRYPDFITINADNDDEYYWTKVRLADQESVYGRYTAEKSIENKSLDLTFIKNIYSMQVEWLFPWPQWDTLRCHWNNLDSSLAQVQVFISPIPRPISVTMETGMPVAWSYFAGEMNFAFAGQTDFVITFPTIAEPDIQHISIPEYPGVVSAFPNPFNSVLTLNISCPASRSDNLMIYNILGRVVKSQTVELRQGIQQVTFSGHDLPSGIYFVSLRDNPSQPLRIMLLK